MGHMQRVRRRVVIYARNLAPHVMSHRNESHASRLAPSAASLARQAGRSRDQATSCPTAQAWRHDGTSGCARATYQKSQSGASEVFEEALKGTGAGFACSELHVPGRNHMPGVENTPRKLPPESLLAFMARLFQIIINAVYERPVSSANLRRT